jgi:hypothetical protein
LTTTFQPLLANSSAVAAPMPEDEPVTTQTLVVFMMICSKIRNDGRALQLSQRTTQDQLCDGNLAGPISGYLWQLVSHILHP